MASEERVFLTPEEAEAMLPEGDAIHTFRDSPGILIGADRDREKIIEALNKYKPELSGGMAARMNHGIVLFDNVGALFIETKKLEDGE